MEECLYFSDINPTNIFICRLLIDPCGEYSVNCNEGNTLGLDVAAKWGLGGFDAVIGNPPYNSSGNTGTGNTIWQDFTKKSLVSWIVPGGYLAFVHPPGWRKPNTVNGRFYGLYRIMTSDNQMLHLSIHGISDGNKTFNCGTRYDWYVIEKRHKYTSTTVCDEHRITHIVDLSALSWLPNANFATVRKMLAGPGDAKCPVIYSRSAYGSDNKKHISHTCTEIYTYPVIHTIPRNGIRYIYSSINTNGHFGISKVIFGDNGLNGAVIDMAGAYGMSENSIAIHVADIDEANNIHAAVLCPAFKDIIRSCIIGNFRIDWRLFAEFKRDFWREFV